MKIDVLAFAAHPDDVELACSGTLIGLQQKGKSIGIIDLTQGEMGTRGSAELRLKEAEISSGIMKLSARENLNLGDARFEINQENKLRVVEMIRKYKPQIIMINAKDDRHIDHPRAAELVKQAAFLSGLSRLKTFHNNEEQKSWRPRHVFHYIQFDYIIPDFVVDISAQMDLKMSCIQAFESQFYNPESKEPSTLISTEQFLKYVEARAREMGSRIKREFGEGFNVVDPLPLDLTELLPDPVQ
jgi:bacillithiol biosynthesis deacetylase BshB1